MSAASWIILIVSLLGGAILLEAVIKRGKRSKPLHEKFGAKEATKPPLGMEATDIESFDQVNHLNKNLARRKGVQMIRNAKPFIVSKVKKRTSEDHAKIFTPKNK